MQCIVPVNIKEFFPSFNFSCQYKRDYNAINILAFEETIHQEINIVLF